MPFVASGSYGCVFKPHLPCSTKQQFYNKSVGKVFEYKEDFAQEMTTIKNIINKVDPNHMFTLPMFAFCDVNTSRIAKRDHAEQCPLMTGNTQKQLIIKDGGKSIDELITTKQITYATFRKLVALMVPICEGIIALNTFGYIHQDIKPDNILYDKKKLYLIDFGIVSKITRHYSKPLRSIYKADYPYFPPEYKLYAKQYKHADEFIADVLQNFMFSMTIANQTLNVPVLMLKELGIDINEELMNLWNSKATPSAQHAPKVDVYQMGLTLFFMWIAVRNKPQNNKITQIIADMVHPNINKRITMNDAVMQIVSFLA